MTDLKEAFEVVEDKLRAATGNNRFRSKYQAELDVMMSGGTLRSSWSDRKVSATFGPLLIRRGFKLHTHTTPNGVVMWAEKKQEAF